MRRKDWNMKSQYGIILAVVGSILFFNWMSSWAADWKRYSETPEALYSYDPKSVIISENEVIGVKVKLDFTDKGISEMVEEFGQAYQDIGYELNDYEIKCGDKKFRVLSVARYSRSGKMLLRVLRDDGSWTSIPPDSTSESLRKLVCSTP